MSGYFLVLEGLDGSGKSEVSRRLAAHLNAHLNNAVMLTYEPHDDCAAGVFLRQVLALAVPASPRTQALAFAVNRADHNDRVIAPFLADERRMIVCDRYYLSSLVYQHAGGLTMDDVMALNQGARTPNLTLFLDASAETAYQRLGSRGKTRELFDHRLNETRDGYLNAIAYLRGRGESIAIIDANGDLLSVINGVIGALAAHAPAWVQVPPLAALPPLPPQTDLRPAMAVFEKHFLKRPMIQWE
ncbi:MAG: dTMP kinase [bacterium]|nr:dTMP kinase [bacterium]